MKNFLLICFIAFFPSVMYSQLMDVVRENCTPSLLNTEETPTVSGGRPLRLPSISTQWDSTRVYRQAVILVSYIDTDFSLENQERIVHAWIEQKEYKLGNIMNAWRLTLVGEGKGPGMFDISAFLGKEETLRRMRRAIETLG